MYKGYTDTNVELKHRMGNILSSLIGGFTYDIRIGEDLPANSSAGANQRCVIIHGVLLLSGVLAVPVGF
jgi:hypothetical protein